MAGRSASAAGRVAVAAGDTERCATRRYRGGRGLLASSYYDRPPPECQVPGAARRHEPEPPLAAARQACRGPRVAGTGLRLVHRRLRHGGPPGGQGVVRGVDGGAVMTFKEVLAHVIDWLQQDKRITYRALKRQFDLDDAYLEDLKAELIQAKHLAVDEEGVVLVWAGASALSAPTAPPDQPMQPPVTQGQPTPQGEPRPPAPPPDAERRQLTVLFCDLVDSTALSSQLDPEDLREVVRAYQETCAKVIARFEGHIAQYLGDGLLVYFGYPLAHEDDAQRAVRAGLGMIDAMGQLNTRLAQERGVHLAVRLGLHTGLVVVGDVGGGTRQEQLALGETPNLAARLQSIAAPNTLVISVTTFHLLGGFFACQPLGTPPLKGQAQPLAVYRVLYESMARSRLEAAE